jgi:hypothetical protein
MNSNKFFGLGPVKQLHLGLLDKRIKLNKGLAQRRWFFSILRFFVFYAIVEVVNSFFG